MKNESLAKVIGSLLGQATVGAVTAPFKLQDLYQKTTRKANKALIEGTKKAAKGYYKGITTPLAKASYTPLGSEPMSEYMGRALGTGHRSMAKAALVTVPAWKQRLNEYINNLVWNSLRNVGQAEYEAMQGFGQGVAQTPEAQRVAQAVQTRLAKKQSVPTMAGADVYR